MKRGAVRNMSCDAIDAKPIDYDWTKGYGETWECVEASHCQECNAVVIGREGDRHSDVDDESECPGHIGGEGPMMSYYYPLAIEDTDAAARVIVDLPLCVVTVDGTTGLALTGGGMDLTWPICEAFMLLDHLPPLHFASKLPRMSGRGTSKRDRWIAAGCIRSCVVAAGWAKGGAAEVRRTLAWARKHEAERKAADAKRQAKKEVQP